MKAHQNKHKQEKQLFERNAKTLMDVDAVLSLEYVDRVVFAMCLLGWMESVVSCDTAPALRHYQFNAKVVAVREL